MDYNTYNAAFKCFASELSGAQAHGIATALLCTNNQSHSEQWLAELRLEAIDSDHAHAFTYLFISTQQELINDNFIFQLFLPDDTTPLTLRVVALKEWCQGFLYGLGVFNANHKNWSRQAKEIMLDFTELTKLEECAESEEDENDFVELVQYCKAAVLLLHAEINP